MSLGTRPPAPVLTLADVRDRGTLSVEEAAAVLGVGRRVVYDEAKRGNLPSVRIGRRVVIPIPALLRMLGDDPHLTTPQVD